MNSKDILKSLLLVTCVLLSVVLKAQHDHDSPKQPVPPASTEVDGPQSYGHQVVFPPIPFDSAMDTKIYGEVKRLDGDTQAVFHLKTEPMPDKERLVSNGTKFLLLNEWLTPRRSFQKILVKVLSNPPSNNFVGDTGWIELSHTTLFQYYDNDLNRIDRDFVYKKYSKAAAKFRDQGNTTTCKKNKKCYLNYADYYDCLALTEKEHTQPKCAMKNCVIEECLSDTPK
jgi:hypothetical protein